jgi:hypothetical protein
MPSTIADRQRTFTTIGSEYTKGREDQFSAIFDSLKWEPVTGSKPFAQGEAIKAAIQQLRIPKVSEVALHGVWEDPGERGSAYGVYGIRGHYKNGTAEVFIIDSGVGITVLCSDLYPNGKEGE